MTTTHQTDEAAKRKAIDAARRARIKEVSTLLYGPRGLGHLERGMDVKHSTMAMMMAGERSVTDEFMVKLTAFLDRESLALVKRAAEVSLLASEIQKDMGTWRQAMAYNVIPVVGGTPPPPPAPAPVVEPELEPDQDDDGPSFGP